MYVIVIVAFVQWEQGHTHKAFLSTIFYAIVILTWREKYIRWIFIRNPEKGALRKFVANCAPNVRKIAGISFRASEEGCAHLSQICREFEVNFGQFYANTPFPIPPSPKFLIFMYVMFLWTTVVLSSNQGMQRVLAFVPM